MKKQLLFILLMLLPLAASADLPQKIDGIFYFLNRSDKTAQVARWTYFDKKYTGDIVIPSTVTTKKNGAVYNVTSIESNAFSNCTEMTSLTIPNSITNIGNRIVTGCSNLVSIVLEEGNPTYDSRENCNAIIETASNRLTTGCKVSKIPNGITTIGIGAFQNCASLTSISIPNRVTTIGESAFQGCTGLTSIIIPDGVTSLGSDVISGCSGLTSVYLGKGLVKIPNYFFKGCNNLKTVEINNNTIVSKNYDPNITEEDNLSWLFFDSNIEKVILGEDVTSIGYKAFFGSTITSLKMTDNIKTIEDYAFMECSELTSVELSNSLTDIGEWAFWGCGNLLSVTIPQSVKCVHLFAFQMCNNLTKVVVNSNEVVARNNEQFYTLTSCFGKQVKEYVLGEDVTKIAFLAFAENNNLTTVTIPQNVTCIEDSVFYSCSGINDIYCYAEQVPEIGKDVFLFSNYTYATLHVPATSLEAYKAANEWKDFGNIVALTDDDPKPTAISEMEYAPLTTNKAIYDLQGHQLTQPKKGLNIIKMSNGKTKKVIIK